MPLYEYVCENDGEVLTLLRPMREADHPVDDPSGRGRVFIRKHSTFAAVGGAVESSGGGVPLPMGGGCCPCGKSAGHCGRG